MTLNISCQFLLTCKVSFKKSADSLMWNPLQVTNYFFLAAFNIPSSSTLKMKVIFGILIMICLVVGLFASILFGTLCASWTCMSISLNKLGTFSFTIFSDRFPITCSFSSSGTHVIRMLDLLKLSQMLLILSSFFFFLDSFSFWCSDWLFFLPYFEIIDLILCFIHSTIDSL